MPKRGGDTSHRRIETALAALTANTRKAYHCAWRGWQSWAAEQGRQPFPAAAGDVADFLLARHEGGAAPATIHVARAAIAKMHQVSGQPDPTADSLCRNVLRRIDREGRDRGRGQVTGVGWELAEAAAAGAAGSGRLQGLRDSVGPPLPLSVTTASVTVNPARPVRWQRQNR